MISPRSRAEYDEFNRFHFRQLRQFGRMDKRQVTPKVSGCVFVWCVAQRHMQAELEWGVLSSVRGWARHAHVHFVAVCPTHSLPVILSLSSTPPPLACVCLFLLVVPACSVSSRKCQLPVPPPTHILLIPDPAC